MMRTISYIIPLLLATTVFTACREDGGTEPHTGELTLSAGVGRSWDGYVRALGDDFFVTGSAIDVAVTTNKPGGQPQEFVYVYGSDRVFRGDPTGFFFTLDDDYIESLTALWPTQAVRDADGGVVTDQRELENFKQSDWMSASAETASVMPTDTPVPLVFRRENTMLEFELVGQNTQGLNIKELLIELRTGGQPTAYWAYCGDPSGHAQLILPPGTQLTSPDNYLIGRVTVGDDNPYTIIFPQTDLVMEAGRRYLVTLTPQGYFMTAYVFIGGFNENAEDGIGIPFRQPEPDVNGSFAIDTPLQLITMSYLIRNYTAAFTFDWPSRKYIIADDFQMTDEYAGQYIPVPDDMFSGIIVYESDQNTAVTSVPYTDGEGQQQQLQLFSN